MERVEFLVEGSQGDQYAVTFEVDGSNANAFCTCPAGSNGQYCKHRFGIMNGEVSRLLSGNTADVVRLKTLMRGTFGVPEVFRDQLDILQLQYVDKERSKELRKQQPKDEDGRPPTVYRMVWSRGVPPFLNFDVGDVFYDPDIRNIVWADALKVLRRAAQVTEAKSDDPPGTGWVKFNLCHYEDGKAVRTESHSLSQAEFEAFLRTGCLSPASLSFKQP